MSGISITQTVGRVVALLLLLIAAMGPWLFDSHPATQETCSAPLVWLGDGQCACLVSLVMAFWVSISLGQGLLWIFCLLPAIPFLSTFLILRGSEQRLHRIFHLAAWGLAAAFSLFLFIGSWVSHRALILWGAGLYSVVAITTLAGEVWAARLGSRLMASGGSR